MQLPKLFDTDIKHRHQIHALWYATYGTDYNPLIRKPDPTLQRNDDSDDSTEVQNQPAEVTTTDNHYYSID